MPEKSLIATPIVALLGLVAGVVQMGVILTLGVRLKPAQIVGAFIVSSFIGACVSTVLQEWLNLNSFLAAAIGVGSGIVPAAVSSSVITRKALERADLTPEQVTEMLNINMTATQPTPEDPK